MEIKLTYEYVKREIEKLIEPQDKLDRAIELLAEYNAAMKVFDNDPKTYLFGRTLSGNSLKAKGYLQSVIDSLKKVLEKPEKEKTYNVKSLAKFLDISESAVYKLAETGKIRYSKPTGKRIYFAQADVEEYLAKEKSTTQDDINREATKHILFNKNKKSK